VSPGRESFGAALALAYDSRQGNSPFGVGWTLSGVPSIGRDTSRALRTYRDGADRFVRAGDQELVPSLRQAGDDWRPIVDPQGDYTVQRFRSKVERAFERFEKWTHRISRRVHWIAYTRNGSVSVFRKAGDNSTHIGDPVRCR